MDKKAIRPRAILLDDDVVRNIMKIPIRSSKPNVLLHVPVSAPVPVPVHNTSLEDTMARVAHNVSDDISVPNDEEEEEDDEEKESESNKITMLPDNGVYTLIVDRGRFADDEASEQRNQAHIDQLVVGIRGGSDIFGRLGRSAHSEKNWDLAVVALTKVAEHLGNLAMELEKMRTFSKKRAGNITRLTQRMTAVAAGAIPTMPTEKEAVADDTYLYFFNNDTLAPYATNECLVLSSFETSQS
jgi:hypothetical protein